MEWDFNFVKHSPTANDRYFRDFPKQRINLDMVKTKGNESSNPVLLTE